MLPRFLYHCTLGERAQLIAAEGLRPGLYREASSGRADCVYLAAPSELATYWMMRGGRAWTALRVEAEALDESLLRADDDLLVNPSMMSASLQAQADQLACISQRAPWAQAVDFGCAPGDWQHSLARWGAIAYRGAIAPQAISLMSERMVRRVTRRYRPGSPHLAAAS